MRAKSGIFVGKNSGFVVTKVEVNPKKGKPSYRKGSLGQRVKFVRDVIKEVAGFAPYERRMIDLIRIGDASKDKKAMQVAKKRLGGHRRGKAKKNYIKEVVAIQKKAAKDAAAKEKARREAEEKAKKE